MKNIIGTILQTNNQPYASKKIIFALQDRYERNVAAMSKDGQIISSQLVVTEADGSFSVSLESLDAFAFDYFYKMSFDISLAPSLTPLKLYIYGGLDAVVDYKKCLLKQPRLDMFYELVERDGSFIFNKNIENSFDNFFAGENCFFKQEEHNLVNCFISFADDKMESDVMRAIDEYLATITGVENA